MILLVNSDDFKGRVPFSDGIQDDDLTPHIRTTQIEIIKKTLTQKLYDEIQDQLSKNELSDKNALLFATIKECHVYYAAASFLNWAKYRVTNYSVVVKKVDESEPAETEDIAKLVTSLEGWAQTFHAELKQFLYEKREDYPLWKDCLCDLYRSRTRGSFGFMGVGKNMKGKRISEQLENAYDFDLVYDYWCKNYLTY